MGHRVNKDINNNFKADIDLELTATGQDVQLCDGRKTGVYSYAPQLIKGQDKTFDPLADAVTRGKGGNPERFFRL